MNPESVPVHTLQSMNIDMATNIGKKQWTLSFIIIFYYYTIIIIIVIIIIITIIVIDYYD